MSSVLGGCGKGGSPLISQAIGKLSLLAQVNTAGDPRHVVTLVGLVVKIADSEGDIGDYGDRLVLTSDLTYQCQYG